MAAQKRQLLKLCFEFRSSRDKQFTAIDFDTEARYDVLTLTDVTGTGTFIMSTPA